MLFIYRITDDVSQCICIMYRSPSYLVSQWLSLPVTPRNRLVGNQEQIGDNWKDSWQPERQLSGQEGPATQPESPVGEKPKIATEKPSEK